MGCGSSSHQAESPVNRKAHHKQQGTSYEQYIRDANARQEKNRSQIQAHHYKPINHTLKSNHYSPANEHHRPHGSKETLARRRLKSSDESLEAMIEEVNYSHKYESNACIILSDVDAQKPPVNNRPRNAPTSYDSEQEYQYKGHSHTGGTILLT